MGHNSLYLIDGHSYLYRAFHAIPYLSNSKGLPTNAIYGFTNMLSKLIREKSPDYLAVAFDAEKPTHRHEAYEAYKAHRPQMPDPLVVQIPYVRKVLEAFRIPILVQEGVEADDLIGTIAKKAADQGMEVTIVSGDKDMFQLVSSRIRIYDTMRDRMYGEEEVRQKLGVEPWQVVEIMGLMGDTVDNIPGVPGVGEKTAADLIRQFGSIEGLLANIDAVKKPKLRETLRTYSEQMKMSRELARLDLTVPWPGEPAHLKRADLDTQALIQLFRELEFSTLLKGLLQPAPSENATDHPPEADTTSASSALGGESGGHLRLRQTQLTADFIQTALQAGSVGLVGIGYPILKGMALSCGQERCVFTTLDPESEIVLKSILESPRIKKVGHDLKPLLRALIPMGIKPRGIYFDTMVASYILSPGRRSHDLVDLGMEYLDRPIQVQDQALPEMMEQTACEAAEALLEISGTMKGRLEERDQSHLYDEVELPLIEVLAEMEHHGFRIDTERLGALSKELERQLQGLIQRIYLLAHGEFNLNSPKQLSEVLFDRLGLKPIKKTKTGYSTDEGVLSQLALVHELPAEILNYRQLAKLKSTYVDALPQMVHPQTGRLHTTFHQTVTATGRLSSSDPNLQNIPIRGEWGQRIRQAFIAEEGYRLLSSDYNQIELRILAHLSQDEQLVKAFQEGRDIHTATASNIFKLPADLITAEMRRAAKTVNFGVIYGMGPYALSSELGTSQGEARQYIDSYFDHYEGVKRFVESTIEEARRLGYVTTLLNRRREVPEIVAPNATTRSLGERIAVNTVIQGSAADLMKLAMVKIFREMQQAGQQSKMILQIHDELVFEVPEGEVEAMKVLVQQQMEGVVSLSVPVKVDLEVGRNWAEIH
jgi:DNA polymerase-1